MNKVILSNEEEANEELMWQPTALTADSTATTMSTRAATCCSVAVTGVTLSKSTLELEVNETATLTATVLPSDADNKAVSWDVDKPSIVTVSSSGLVCAKNTGTATIIVTTKDGNKTAKCNVTVKENIKVTEIALSHTALLLNVNDSELLHANVYPNGATKSELEWTSSDSKVATIGSSGFLCACKEGKTTITVAATDGSGVTAKCEVTVVLRVTKLQLCTNSVMIKKGKTTQLEVDILPANVKDKSIIWSSSNPVVAEVDNSGLITAKSEGNTDIIVKTPDERVSAKCEVKVIFPKYGSIIYQGEEYLIDVPSGDTISNKKLVANCHFLNTFEFNDMKFWKGFEIENEGVKTDAIYAGNNRTYPIVKDAAIYPGIAFLNTLLSFATAFQASVDNQYIDFFFYEHDDKTRSVQIKAGSIASKQRFENYADEVEQRLSLIQEEAIDKLAVSPLVSNLYSELTGEEAPEGEYDIIFKLDKRHKEDNYVSYLWINAQGEIIERPITYDNDCMRIVYKKNLLSAEETLCYIDLSTEQKVNDDYQNLFGQIYENQ